MGCKSLQEVLKKRKKKIAYKSNQYRNKNTESMEAYPWDQCIKDQMKEYGDKETAEKVCASIKNRTVNR